NWIERADGTIHEMSGTDTAPIHPGDVWVLETPGGGGYGEPMEEEKPEAAE
ncbi:MAG: hydantoinase B/oxoprolinase family protein, partial [Proteobacteria bacterium]|nr:hydantoinase B/oxoprolinase family protein [Pseudomonadota bacterium]